MPNVIEPHGATARGGEATRQAHSERFAPLPVFEVTRGVLHGHAMLRINGDLDIATVPELAAAFDSELATLPAPTSLGFDLSDTTFIDSSGARAIAVAFRRAEAAGTGLYVLCPPANARVRRTLSLLRLDDVIPVVDSVRPDTHPSD